MANLYNIEDALTIIKELEYRTRCMLEHIELSVGSLTQQEQRNIQEKVVREMKKKYPTMLTSQLMEAINGAEKGIEKAKVKTIGHEVIESKEGKN